MNDESTGTPSESELERAMQKFRTYEPPRALFRFYGAHGLRILVEGKLRITPPREFNDPFEFAPGINPKLETHPPTADELRRHFLAPNGVPRAAFFSAWGNGDENQYKAAVEKRILRRDLFSRHVQCMREGMTNAISAAYGVICFSAFSAADLKAPSAVRHWAAYADDHRGLAIEFNGAHSFFKTPAKAKWLFPVKYQNKRTFSTLSEYEDDRQTALVRTLRAWAERKSRKPWGDENEWRLIAPLSTSTKIPISRTVDGERVLFFLSLWQPNPPDERQPDAGQVVRRVILGSRASSVLEASVRTALREPHLRHVKLSRARANQSNYGLDITDD